MRTVTPASAELGDVWFLSLVINEKCEDACPPPVSLRASTLAESDWSQPERYSFPGPMSRMSTAPVLRDESRVPSSMALAAELSRSTTHEMSVNSKDNEICH